MKLLCLFLFMIVSMVGCSKSDSSDDKKMQSEKEKEYAIIDNHVVPMTFSPGAITKKEIKIIRNRVSEQKSRDKQKLIERQSTTVQTPIWVSSISEIFY